MAKKKKKRTKKYRPTYTTGGRVDMRTGGRVKAQIGGVQEKLKKPISTPDEKPVTGGPVGQGVAFNGDNEEKDPPNDKDKDKNPPDIDDTPDETAADVQGQGQAFGRNTIASEARQERIARTEAEAEARAAGKVPDEAIIDPAVQVDEDIEQGTTTMQDVPGFVDTTVEGTTAQGVTPETVTTGDVTTAAQVEDIETKKAKVDTIDEKAEVGKDVKAAQTNPEDMRLAEAADVADVQPIEGADVKDPEGALAERVVGKLSETAKANAATNAGTSLARITRAKKQLSRAGLSDADIAEIGNDPEALEDRLADFSEEERGLIAGLPEEALVSTQLNGLLEGMENGQIPPWAAPAVAQVEQMLAARGLSASTVGRDSLFNAIIQSAMPIAQSNAQALQQSVVQQRDIEARVNEANAQRQQQVALDRANKVFNMNMAQFTADQQTELSKSKFLQTVSLTEASNDQQATIQTAALKAQENLAEANLQQQAEIRNAQAFLQMDMANLNNRQQANMVAAQQNQQRMLSNQAATNAAEQFNAANENQMNQFVANLGAQIDQYNTSQANAMEQFNASSQNAAEARRAGREADVEKFNAQLLTQVEQFNSQQDFARNQWNAQNAAAVEASNVQWRRQTNTVNTAAQNQINMQNAMNAFNMSSQNQAFLWQELRDQADFDFRAFENNENRAAQILATAIANEGKAGERYDDKTLMLIQSLANSFGGG
jgi:hypothetical protein